MPVIEGKANFVHIKNTEEYRGKDTGTFSMLMTLNETDAQTFENRGVRLKPYGEPPEQIIQRKFKSNYPVKIIDSEGVDIRAVSEFIHQQQTDFILTNEQTEDYLDEDEEAREAAREAIREAAIEAATAAAVKEYGKSAVDLALADEIPSGVFRVSFKYGASHPVHGVPVYMDGIRILEVEGVAGVDPAL